MAARIEPDVILPVSTGQVQTPGPVTVEQPADATSTGAVPAPDTVVTTEFGAAGPQSTGTVETPGPVTTRTAWAKVVRPAQRPDPRTTTTAETRQPDGRQAGEQVPLRAQRGDEDQSGTDGR